MVFVSNGQKRKPTINELKVLSTFPEDFNLEGTYNQQWGMIGNCVPPKLTETLGNNVIQKILWNYLLVDNEISQSTLVSKKPMDPFSVGFLFSYERIHTDLKMTSIY